MAAADASGPIRTVELRSDTFTLPTAEMLDAMVRVPLGDDVYGEDPTVNALEQRAAEMLGKAAAIFMPSGTMANLGSLMAHCPRGAKVIVGEDSDIYVYEAGGASVCGGITYHPLPNQADGTLALDDIESAFPLDPGDSQFALPALICLENPQNHTGGRVLPLDYLGAVRELADRRGVTLHIDGARIFNAAVAAGVPVSTIAAYADSLQFCLSKGLSSPVGSMVVGDVDFIARVRRIRKMLGGGMRQSGVLAAAGLVSLNSVAPRMHEDHATARQLAEGLATVPGVDLDPRPVHINMVFFRLADPHADLDEFVERVAAHGVRVAELGKGRVRCVTHMGVATADIDRAVDVITTVLADEMADGIPGGPIRSGAHR